MEKIIYLDNASTTKVDKEVLKILNSIEKENYGNPSSIHKMGENSKKIIEESREKIAKKLNCLKNEIIFTSGATESNNLTILGLAKANPSKRKIITSAIEHSSIKQPLTVLKQQGYKIIEIKVDNEGILDLENLKKEIDKNTLLVSIIHANNELGVLQNIKEISKITQKNKTPLHIDASQSFTKIPIDVKKLNIDLLSATAHKIHGPKGIGLLYKNNKIKITPLIFGGNQENSLRAGTQSTQLIASFAKAVELQKENSKLEKLSDYFTNQIEKINGKINGHKTNKIKSIISVTFENIDAEYLLFNLSQENIMCSTRSACNSRNKENSVLKAINLTENQINSTIRFSLSKYTTKQEIDYTIKTIKELITKFKNSPK
jgi:cysteine desulfurase